LFLEFSDRKLVEMTKKLATCVERLSEEQVWARGGAHENAMGNLMLHLCGNMRQWIMSGVGGSADVRTRDEEFSADCTMTKAELLRMFTETVTEARGVIASLPHERLTETIHPQGRETSVLGAIYQVVGHVQEHVGQVILLTKQMVGTDLDLTLPRKR
jgi:uncharacterized damage-inducible protein DinB